MRDAAPGAASGRGYFAAPLPAAAFFGLRVSRFLMLFSAIIHLEN